MKRAAILPIFRNVYAMGNKLRSIAGYRSKRPDANAIRAINYVGFRYGRMMAQDKCRVTIEAVSKMSATMAMTGDPVAATDCGMSPISIRSKWMITFRLPMRAPSAIFICLGKTHDKTNPCTWPKLIAVRLL